MRVNLIGTPAISSTLGYVGNFSVNWKYNGNSAGISTSPLYVSYGFPLTWSYKRTVVHLALKNGIVSAGNDDQMVSTTFNSFTGKNVTTWDGVLLYYYKAGTTFGANALSADDLLLTRTGQCGAWQDLFTQCLSVNGLEPTPISAYGTDVSEAFLVKDWTKDAATRPLPYAWRITLATGADMVPVPAGSDYGDLRSSTTLSGQNSSPPSQKVFGGHFFVQFGQTYFDPSYGVTYTGPNDFVSKAVFGFGGPFSDNGITVTLDVRDPVGQSGITFW